MPIQIGAKGANLFGQAYPPYAYIDWFTPDQEATALAGGGAVQVPSRSLTPAQVVALKSLAGGGSVQYAGLFLGAGGIVTFDAGAGNVMPAIRAIVNAGTDVIAGQQITAGGLQVTTSTIDGSALAGEMIPLGSNGVTVLTCHAGMVGGASQAPSSDTVITLNELVNWQFDASSGITLLYLYLYPPRSSGRYIDAQIFGVKA